MTYVVDATNLLGALRRNRESDEEKRGLVRALGNVARLRKAKIICVFDGAAPGGFATQLGAVTVRFAAPRSADDVIRDQAQKAKGRLHVVTSDNGLAAAVRRRDVSIVPVTDFTQIIASAEQDSGIVSNDWEQYFSDPKNRNI